MRTPAGHTLAGVFVSTLRPPGRFDTARRAMDATTSTALAAYKQYLRRTYATNVPGLRALAEKLIVELTDNVTITSQTFEGGSHSGQITMPPGLKLKAVEELIVELDTEGTAVRPATQSVCYLR